MPDKTDVSELIFLLHRKDGMNGIGQLPGLWSRKLNDQWHIWVNGHFDGPRRTEEPGRIQVAPLDVYLEYDGCPAGNYSLITGQGEIGRGRMANYETFCQALREALK